MSTMPVIGVRFKGEIRVNEQLLIELKGQDDT